MIYYSVCLIRYTLTEESLQGKNKIDISFTEGRDDKSLIVFVHGLGMDKYIWTAPEKSRILAGRYALTALLRKREHAKVTRHKPLLNKKISAGVLPKRLVTLFHRFSAMEYSVITWSQKRPSSHARIALDEIKSILNDYSSFTKKGIIMIGHSRGGLIARRYAMQLPEEIKALISVASPFMGSSLARWADIISKTLFAVNPFFQTANEGTVKNNIKHVLDFINSTAVKELLPGSEFLNSLSDSLPSSIKTLNIAGTSPTLFRLYSWHIERFDKLSGNYTLTPASFFAFPDSIKKLVPDRMIPEELKKGKGDGLVSKKSALSCSPDDIGSYPYNHAALLFAERAQEKIIDFVRSL